MQEEDIGNSSFSVGFCFHGTGPFHQNRRLFASKRHHFFGGQIYRSSPARQSSLNLKAARLLTG
jgi:hypothetical protein